MAFGLVVFPLIGGNGQAEKLEDAKAAAILKTINEMLGNFCYNTPKLELAGDGTILRKDIDGASWTFNLLKIKDMTIDREGQAHVLLFCSSGQECIERPTKTGVEKSSFLAFSIRPADRGDEVLRLFKDLQAALAVSAKK
jgi:hypothetical protein